MATQVYKSEVISLVDGTQLYLTPLKIKYLREFMDIFKQVYDSKNEIETMSILSDCARVAMKQYYPIIKTVEDLEDNIDLKTIYTILEISAGIKMNAKNNSPDEVLGKQENKVTWETLDLAKLEAEVFLLGIWKDYEELELSLSLEELMTTLNSKRELSYEERKFLAGIQGVDLEANMKKSEEDPWEAMKARIEAKKSGITITDANDITSLQGYAAQKAGFGIGMGLEYEKI